MGKYNVGDKFLIEIDQVVKCDNSDPVELFKIKGFNSLVFDKYGLDKLPKAHSPFYDGITLIKAKKEAYEAGLNAAWEAARKICCSPSDVGFTVDKLQRIFGTGVSCRIVKVFEAKEAVEKIKAFESEKEKVCIGDVIKHKNNEKVVLVVTTLYSDGDFAGIKITEKDEFGDLFSYYDKRSLASFEKTGQHYDLNKFFLNDGEDGELPYN